jgi:hypothetical protein
VWNWKRVWAFGGVELETCITTSPLKNFQLLYLHFFAQTQLFRLLVMFYLYDLSPTTCPDVLRFRSFLAFDAHGAVIIRSMKSLVGRTYYLLKMGCGI